MKNTIISCIITAALALLVGYILHLQVNKINKLDKHINYDNNYIAKPKFPNSKIELKVDTIDIEKLGILSVYLVNFSSKDFENQRLRIRVTPDNDEFEMLSYSARGQNSEYGVIKDNLEDGKVAKVDDSYEFDFTVEFINRTDALEEGFLLNILYTGSLNDAPLVTVTGKGIQTRKYEESNRPNEPFIQITRYSVVFAAVIIAIVVIVFFMLLFVNPIMSFLGQKNEIKRNKRYATQLIEAINDEGLLNEYSEEKIKDFIACMLHKRQQNWFEKQPLILKWSNANINPKKSDYEI
jgi:cell division protein FtsL